MKKHLLRRLLAMVLTAAMLLSGVTFLVPQVQAAETPTYRNVVYYGDWSIYAGQKQYYPSKIDGSLITHLNFAFMDVDKNGNLILCDEHADFQAILPEQNGLTYGEPYAGVLGAMVILRAKYPNMKIGISVGGWTRSGDFPAMAGNATSRKNFASNIARFVDYLGYDFVDIDWEYPCDVRDSDPVGNGVTIDKGCAGTPADGHNFTLLMQDIRAELDALGEKNGKYYELSAAMSASPKKMAVIEYDKVLETVDFLNMMTYDLNGAWNGYTAHQTALYSNDSYDPETQPDGTFSVDTCIRYLEDTYGGKLDFSKIVIGVAPYTRGWCGVQNDGPDASCPGLYATAEPNSIKAPDGTLSGTYPITDIPMLMEQHHLKEYYDEKAEAAYYYSEETGYFFTCDNERSVAAKGAYVREKGLGGLISWMASLDSDEKILNTMKKSLYGDADLPDHEIITSNPKISLTIKAEGKTYTITIKNEEKSVESNAAMRDAEMFQKTVMLPKLYIETASGATFSAGSESGSVTNQNGMGIVDLSGVYAAKQMKPGASHTFTINSSEEANLADLVCITATQRILPTMDEFGAQIVYGESGGDPVLPTEPEVTEPEVTEPEATEPEVTEPKPTEPKPTEPKPTEPKPTEPKPTDPKPTQPTGNTWDPSKVYTGGNIVTYNGKEYKAQWWTQGDKPGTNAVWVEIFTGGESGGESGGETSNAWSSSKVYTSGDVVTYNGSEYKAQWWTQGEVPGSSLVWVKISGGTTGPTEPEVTEPEVTEPEVTEPEVTEPEVTEPEVTEPEVTEPEVTEPEVTEPEATEPEATEPEVTEPEPTEPEPTEPEPTDPVKPADPSNLPEHLVTGYWHNFCNGSSNLKLSDIPSYYDLICVAFTGNTSVAGEATFEIDPDLSKALGGYSKEEFIQDIKDLQAKGQHVIISVGGAEGRISITSDAAANTFAQSMIAIIEEYGFEGMDIDLEGGAVAGVAYVAGALRTIQRHFGDDFIITMAPETAYIQNTSGSYLKLALEIKDILTICYPQFYNSGSMIGYDGNVYSAGTPDFITSQVAILVEAGLRPDQIAVGVPSMPSAAGSGYMAPDLVAKALYCLAGGTSSGGFMAPEAYPEIRGAMTWSINWDATQDYAWGKAMAEAMGKLDAGDYEVAPEGGEDGETTWDPTAVYNGGAEVMYKGRTYRAKWWTQGDTPGSNAVWQLVG